MDVRLDQERDAAGLARDILEVYFETRAQYGHADYGDWYRGRINRAATAVRPFVVPLATAAAVFATGTAARRSMLLFDGLRFEHLIRLLARQTTVAVIARKPQDTVRIALSGARVVPAWNWYSDLARALSDPKRAGVPLARLLAMAQQAIARSRATCLIATNDSLPFERLLIAAARETGIPSITVQHGFFSDTAPLALLDGHYGDHFLTWGSDLRQRYVDADSRYETKVHTFGYPYPAPRIAPPPAHLQRPTLLVVGKPVAAYAVSEFGEYVKQVRAVFRGGIAAGYAVVYRRHPGEDEGISRTLKDTFSNISFRGHYASTEQAIAHSSVVVAWGSTMLIEAALVGRRTLDINADEEGSALARAGFALAMPPNADVIAATLRNRLDGPTAGREERRSRNLRLLSHPDACFLETVRTLVGRDSCNSASIGKPK